MPFPGSQKSNTVSFAYFLHSNISWLRVLGFAMLVVPLQDLFRNGSGLQKVACVLVILLYGFIYYLFNFRFLAEKIFYQPKQKTFATALKDTTNKNKIIIGLVINNQAKAFPVELIGYHHQVRDSIAGQPIMVTYCTVCHSGRIYSPIVNGKVEKFRLVGMDHYNAMFEDATTKSWWLQATGEAVTGKLKGQKLIEIPSAQMRLGEWLALYPESSVLQPDSNFKKQYADLKGFDEGTIKGKLERRDSLSWKLKSWVIGIDLKTQSKAYDWNGLVQQSMITDSLAGIPVLLTIEPNAKTFYVLNRKLNGQVLQFIATKEKGLMEDVQTHSSWKMNGICIGGPQKGRYLDRMQAYQEFWHSWKHFHPKTLTNQN
ncbi:MAG: hypothetical protein RLZZ28_1058 [Bacteroidota bacterium]